MTEKMAQQPLSLVTTPISQVQRTPGALHLPLPGQGELLSVCVYPRVVTAPPLDAGTGNPIPASKGGLLQGGLQTDSMLQS